MIFTALSRGGLLALLALQLVACNRPATTHVTVVSPPPVAEVQPTLPPYEEINPLCLGQRVPVIMYHDIIAERGPGSQWFDCTAKEFEDQMQLLKDQGATPISLVDLYGHLTAGTTIPAKAVVLTFDDNYQGFYDNAYAILKKYNYPAVMFVHTGFVGNKTGLHPKMDWPTLQLLVKDPLITIGSHTVSHPDDITKLASDAQTKELTDSKSDLEKQLGVKIDFLAYPDGMNDEVTQLISKQVGYKMAFSIHNQLAEESPNILCVGRYVHTRLQKALDDRDEAIRGGAFGVYKGDLAASPVSFREDTFAGVRLSLVTGGTPTSVLSPTREGVLDFVKRTGGVAGINGGFFAMAAIASTDNRMVGPCKTAADTVVAVDTEKSRWEKLHNRPVVMWGPKSFAIVPYQPDVMVNPESFKQVIPDFTDLFLAGVWLVHEGIPRGKDDQNIFGSKDIQDPRRRAFLGLTVDGKFVAGASRGSCSSEALAQAASAAGVYEAVLLDSGFSTSLVFDGEVKVSGHSTDKIPSRPVPHAIVIMGEKDTTMAPTSAK